jgi:hypothetical protein
MDGEPPLPSSSSLYTGGAGGKARKPPLRNKAATPYDRPPSAIQHPPPRDDAWLSKFVNPAYRLIASGASRILPSFFSRSSSSSDLSSSDPDDLGHDETNYLDTEEITNASRDENHTSTLAFSKTNEEAGPSNVKNIFKENSENTLHEQNTQNLSDRSDLSKIEEMVKGKLFSRDEISRLTEILKSKLVDNDDTDRQKEPLLNNGGETTLSLLGTSTPHLHSKKRDEVATSPADIARAYMGNRASESPFGSYSAIRSKDELSSRPFIPPSSPKPSICWPGAVVQDQLPYSTPQTENAKFGLQNLPRTPYSRTIFSKSKGKLSQLQSDSKSLNISSSPFHHSRSPTFGQVNSGINGYGSVGPIRRLRNKFGSEIRPSGSSSLYSVRNSSSPSKENNSTERAVTNSISKYNSVNTESTQLNSPANETVRKILEQLDRPKPTPKEIEAELKIGTAWKRSSDEGKLDFVGKKNIFDSDKRDLLDQKKDSNNEIGHVSFKTNTQNTDFASKSSSVVFGDANDGSSGVNKTAEATVANTLQKDSAADNTDPKDPGQLWAFKGQPDNGHKFTKVKPPVSTKPALKNISINKPDPKHIVSSENSLSFTFPVSKSSSVSEPPTPSIMPSFSTPQSKEREAAVPTYTFDSKRSTPRLVFSFPSTSGAANSKSDVEAQDIKFKFGSDKRKRVSFSSVGKDAVCI